MKKYTLWIIFPIVVVVLIAYYGLTKIPGTSDTNLGTSEETVQDTQMLVGKWKNSTEEDSVVEFKADATMIDTSQGAVTPGTWKVFTSDLPLPENVEYTFSPGKAYLTVKVERGSRYFLISAISESALELISMDSNDTLLFEKIQ